MEGEQIYAKNKNIIFEKEDENIPCMDQVTGIIRRTLNCLYNQRMSIGDYNMYTGKYAQ